MNRERLKNYLYTEDWIERRLKQIEAEKETISRLNAFISDMPKGNRKIYDQEAENLVKLEDSFRELTEKVIKIRKEQKEVTDAIEKLDFPYKNILFRVYINGETLVDVASGMHYSYGDICRKHGTALKKFDEL